ALGVTEGPRLTVSVLLAEPPLGGVTELGSSFADTPTGAPVAATFTGKLNPPREPIVICDEPDAPTGIVRPPGEAAIEKSPEFSTPPGEVLPLKVLSPP